MKQQVKVNKVIPNDSNPRLIKDNKFRKLVNLKPVKKQDLKKSG